MGREIFLFFKLSRSGDESAPSVTCSRVPTTLTFRKPNRDRLYQHPISSFIYSKTISNCHSSAFYLPASVSGTLAAMVTIIAGQHKHTHMHTCMYTHMHAHTHAYIFTFKFLAHLSLISICLTAFCCFILLFSFKVAFRCSL